MKRIFSIFILIFFLCIYTAYAQLTVPDSWGSSGNTITWDAVTTLNNGDPIPIADNVYYNIYAVQWNKNASDKVKIGSTYGTSYEVTYNGEERFFIGISAVRVIDGELERESAISWSVNPGACEGNHTFGIISYLTPAAPGGMQYSLYQPFKHYIV